MTDAGPELSAGDHVGKYVVRGTIGAGGMGVVLRAHDPELDRTVAIKIVRARALAPDRRETARLRLQSEARALARISHPNVVAIYEVGIHDGDVFVVMELVDGVDLDRWLRARERSIPEIVALHAAVARGLAQVHAAGLVHRDVKPANILVGATGLAKIGDFGLARATFEIPAPQVSGHEIDLPAHDEGTTAVTAEGHVVGTPAYMAPEQHTGSELGPATDQYGLAAALFEALWGVRPFRGDARRLLAAKRSGAVIPSDARAVPRWLVQVVERGLAYAPADRFASMDDFAAALTRSGLARRRWAWATAGALVVGAGATAATFLASPGLCDHDAEALAGAWDPSIRTAMQQAFDASKRPWAAGSWAQVDAAIDGYATQWRAVHRDACEATHVRREHSGETLDRRMACLDDRRLGLAATTALLVAGDDAAIDHAFELLGRLRPVASCATLVAPGVVLTPQDDASLRVPVAAVRAELARARALGDAARVPEALALAETALATARELAFAPLVVEALALVGHHRLRVGPIDAARASLETALWDAIAIGHDEIAATAATDLVWVAGQYDRSLPEALRWAELARANLDRIGATDPRALASVDNAIGAAYQHAARYEDAHASFTAALARTADATPDAVSGRATASHNLAKAWFDRGDLARAREVLEPAIDELAGVLGTSHPRVVAMRGTLAQLLGAAGEHARAVELFTAEVEGLRLAMGDDALAVAHARTNLGVSLGRMGRVDEAIAVTELALAAFERAGDDGGAATCLGNLADDLLSRGIHDAAAARFAQAFALLEKMYPDGHPDLVYPLVGIGRVRMAQGRFADALVAYERADALADDPGGSGQTRSLALDGRARALVALQRDDDALAVLDTLVAITRSAGDVMPDALPLALVDRARVLVGKRRIDEALRDADEAVALATAAGIEPLRVEAVAEQRRAREAARRAR